MKALHLFFWAGLASVIMIRLSFAWAPADQHDTGIMEQRLFQQVYDREAPAVRVNRLEQSVFGATKSGTPEQRLSALRKALPVATVPKPDGALSALGLPVNTASRANAGNSNSSGALATPPQKQANESDYPVVDQIEQKVLGNVFSQEDITVRLPRLETKVFGQPMRGDLSNRVDALSGQVLGPATAANAPSVIQSEDASGNQDITVSPDQVVPAITQMEQQVFRQTYGSDTVENRLGRLENKLFNKTAPPEYTPQERVERIIAVSGAGGQRPVTTRSTAANIAIQLAPILIMMLPLVI